MTYPSLSSAVIATAVASLIPFVTTTGIASAEENPAEEFVVLAGKGRSVNVLTIPNPIETAIINAPKTSDVFPVSTAVTQFGGQILKADTVIFQPNTRLDMTNYGAPWVAIVAKTIQFVDQTSYNVIDLSSTYSPARYGPSPQPPAAARGGDAGWCNQGGTGANGTVGSTGHAGDNAPTPPTLYLIVGALVDRNGASLPQTLNLLFDVRGYSGGDAGNGGQGANGGPGGNGGSSVFKYDPFPDCKCGAGDGGYGGLARIMQRE